MIEGRPVREWRAVDRALFERELLPAGEPALLRGLAADWPAVREGAGIGAYLLGFDTGEPVDIIEGPPAIGGRLFYTPDLARLNFARSRARLADLIGRIEAMRHDPAPPTLCAQALLADRHAPGFTAENRLPLLDPAIAPRLWIGGRTIVAAHNDMARNIAVAVAGRRRFTLFPPDQAGNLYLGPLELTPAGTPVSMVDFDAPDLDRFPRFAEAMAAAWTAELAPGDALYIPYMWWHEVRALDSFGLLVNYWWDTAPPCRPGLAPMDVLLHALLAFPQLPEEQRAAWRALFGHLAFDGDSAAHLPPDRRGIRGAISDEARRRLAERLGRLLTG